MTRALTPKLRLATPEDNEELIALARRCPIHGHLAFYSDRYPDFFALLALQGDKSAVYVVENDEGKIIACASLTEKTTRWGAESAKTLHFGDLRTDPEYRGSRAALQLIRKYDQTLLEGDYHHGLVEFAAGSTVSKAQKFLSPEIDVMQDGWVRMFQLAPVIRYRISRDYLYRAATAEDLPEIARLLSESHDGMPGAPIFNEEALSKILNQHESFRIEDMWLVCDAEGGILACAGLWDQSSIRNIVATNFTRAGKLAVRFLTAAGLLWKLPPIPRVGQAMRYQMIRWPSARSGHGPALAQLIRFLLNKVRLQGHTQFLTMGFHEKDPLVKVVEGLVRVEDKVELYSHRIRERHARLPQLEDQRFFADLCLV